MFCHERIDLAVINTVPAVRLVAVDAGQYLGAVTATCGGVDDVDTTVEQHGEPGVPSAVGHFCEPGAELGRGKRVRSGFPPDPRIGGGDRNRIVAKNTTRRRPRAR